MIRNLEARFEQKEISYGSIAGKITEENLKKLRFSIDNAKSIIKNGTKLKNKLVPLGEPKKTEKEIRKKIEDKKGKVEEIGGGAAPVEGQQDVDPENIKEDMEPKEDAQPAEEEDGRRKRRDRKKDKDAATDEPKKPRKEVAPPKQVPTVIDIKDVKRE